MNYPTSQRIFYPFIILTLLNLAFNVEARGQSKKKQIEDLQNQLDSLHLVITNKQTNILQLELNLKNANLENEQNQKNINDYQSQIKAMQHDLDVQNNNYQKALQNLQQTVTLREKINTQLEKENDSLRNVLVSQEVLINNLTKTVTGEEIASNESSNEESVYSILAKYSGNEEIRFNIGDCVNRSMCSSASALGEWPEPEVRFWNQHYLSFAVCGNIFYNGGAHPEHVEDCYFFNLHTGDSLNFADLISPSNQAKLVDLFNQKFNQEIEERSKTGFCMDNTISGEIELSPFYTIQGVMPEGDGISMGYSDWSYAERVCDITIRLTWEEIRPYIPSTFYD
jgi:hypothetical protein